MDLDQRQAALRAALARGEPDDAIPEDEQHRRETLIREVLAWAIDAALHHDLWVRGHLLMAFRGLCDGQWAPFKTGLESVLAPADMPRRIQTEQEIEEATIADLLDLEELLTSVCGRPSPPSALVSRYARDEL